MQNLTNTNNWLISNQRHLDSEYTKVLKETTAKFTSKLIEQENNISSLNTSFEELLDKISVSNRFDSKIESYELDLEATIDMKFDKIKDDQVKTINYLDMKISAIT